MRLFVGFKGKNNTSRILVEELSPVHLLLTNSFTGLRKDIDSISKKYDHVLIFGVDKTLTSEVRIEKYADKEGIRYASKLDLHKIVESVGYGANYMAFKAIIEMMHDDKWMNNRF